MAYPVTGLTNAVDGSTDVVAAHLNALEAKVGVDGSAVTTSHDYKLSGVTGSDVAASKAGTETLTNKTLTSPVINTSVSGTAILDEDNMASDSNTKLATQQSIKAYVDAATTGLDASNIDNRTRHIWLSPYMFGADLGSPAITVDTTNFLVTWRFDAAAKESITSAFFFMPADFVSGNIAVKAYWAMESATSGNVRIQVQYITVNGASENDINGLGTDMGTFTESAPGTAHQVKQKNFGNLTTYAAGYLGKIRFTRDGADGADTAAGDLHLLGILLEYTADM